MYKRNNLLFTICHLLITCGAYILFVLPIVKSETLYPAHDNLERHLTNYLYFANSLKYGFGIPLWYPFNGGLPIGITSAFMFSLIPHRILGYALYAIFPLTPTILYKINLLCGILIISVGWWLFLRKFTTSRLAATIGSLILFLGGSGITIFHQEQIIATMTWLPWLLLTLLKSKEDPRFIMATAILAGFCLNLHNPHNHIIIFIFLALLLTGEVFGFIRSLIKHSKLRYLFLSCVLFILAASPVLYVTRMQSSFSSPHRGYEENKADTFCDYVKFNKTQTSSATIEYLKNYIRPQIDAIDDQYAFFVTLIGIWLAALGLIFAFKSAMCIVIILLLCLWAVLGINGQFAQILYLLKFPFISYFRQWYHFVPMINFCLSALGALGVAGFFSFLSKRIPHSKKIPAIYTGIGYRILTGMLALGVCTVVYYESRQYFTVYTAKCLRHISRSLPRLDKNEYLQLLKEDWFSRRWMEQNIDASLPADVSPLLVYRDWYKLSLENPQGLPNVPFCIRQSSTEKTFYPKEDYTVTPRGIKLEGSTQERSLIVFPFAYKLGFMACLNRQKVGAMPIYEGAMTSVIVPEGRFSLTLSVPMSFYQVSVAIQTLLLASIIIFLTRPKKVSEGIKNEK